MKYTKNWFWELWKWKLNPKCKECKGDGMVHFDGEDIFIECEHCDGLGYIYAGNEPLTGKPILDKNILSR